VIMSLVKFSEAAINADTSEVVDNHNAASAAAAAAASSLSLSLVLLFVVLLLHNIPPPAHLPHCRCCTYSSSVSS